MQTTINEIKKYNPSDQLRQKLLNNSKAGDEPLDFMTILEAVGIEDTIWCLRVLDYKDYCLFLADVAEFALPIFELEYPEDKVPKETISAIRNWHSGDITKEQLKVYARGAACCAVFAAYDDNDDAAAYAAYVASAANVDIDAAVYAINTVAAIVPEAAYAAWKKIEELFIKHFGGRTCRLH